jgi:hypothetical protein
LWTQRPGSNETFKSNKAGKACSIEHRPALAGRITALPARVENSLPTCAETVYENGMPCRKKVKPCINTKVMAVESSNENLGECAANKLRALS